MNWSESRQGKEYPWYLFPSCIGPLKYRTISWETVGPSDIPTEGVYSPWTLWMSDTNMQSTDPQICRFNAFHAGSDLNLQSAYCRPSRTGRKTVRACGAPTGHPEVSGVALQHRPARWQVEGGGIHAVRLSHLIWGFRWWKLERPKKLLSPTENAAPEVPGMPRL